MCKRRCPCCSSTLVTWATGDYCRVCRKTFVKRPLLRRMCLGWLELPDWVLARLAAKVDPAEQMRLVFVAEWHWPFFRYVRLCDVDRYWEARRARGEPVEGPLKTFRRECLGMLGKGWGWVVGWGDAIPLRNLLVAVVDMTAFVSGVALWLTLMTFLCATSLLLTGKLPWRLRRHFT